MADNESITVTVPDQPDSGDVVVVKERASDSPESGIEDLRRQLADAQSAAQTNRRVAEEEGRRRAEAEQTARAYANQAAAYGQHANEAEYSSLLNALSANQREIGAAQGEYKIAMEAGDYDAASQLQVMLSRLAARQESMENGKNAADNVRSRQPAPQAPAQQAAPAGPAWDRAWSPQETETVLRQYSARTAAWIREHPQFANDPQFRKQVTAAHEFAVSKGISPDTDDYFRQVDALVSPADQGTGHENMVSYAPTPAPAAPRQAAAPAAPPSRNVPSSRPQDSNSHSVTLSKEERDIAPQLFPNDADPEKAYATYKLQCERENRFMANR